MNNERIERMDKLIAEAMKNKEMNKVATLRLVKTKMLEFVTAKNAKPLDEAAEMQILKKMATERKESIKIYEDAGRERTMFTRLLYFIHASPNQ